MSQSFYYLHKHNEEVQVEAVLLSGKNSSVKTHSQVFNPVYYDLK